MHPLWIVLLGVLLGQCLSGPEIETIARVVAGMAAILLVWREKDRRRWVLLALLLGLVLGGRLQTRVLRAASVDGWEGEAVLLLKEDTREGLAWAWVRRASGPVVVARLSSLGDRPRGSRGRASVRLWMPPSRRNPDDLNRRRAALARSGLLRGKALSAVVWEDSPPLLREGSGERLRRGLHAKLSTRLGQGSALWEALLLGDRSGLSEGCRRRFRRLGLAHLLALSGLHVGLVAALLLRIRRPRRKGAALWILFPLASWAFAAGLSPSLVRAVVMAAWLLGGKSLGRSARAVDALAAAGLVELFARGSSVVALGWWLSYGATLALLRVVAQLPRRRWVAAVVAVVVAPLGTLPWTLSAFGRLPLAAPLWNLILGPVFAVFMGVGMILVGVALVVPPLSNASLFLTAVGGHCFGSILKLLAHIDPGAMGHPGITGSAWTLALVAGALLLVPEMPGRFRHRLILALGLVAMAHAGLVRTPQAQWWSLDVGQGDGGVLQVGRRSVLVVDAGNGPFGTGEERVMTPYLRRRNLKGVDLLVSHGHRDHYGGARALVQSGRVRRLYLAAVDRKRKWTGPLLAAARDHGVEVDWVARGDTLAVGSWHLICLWPPLSATGESTNDRSLVLRGGPLGREMLWTGDLEAPAERKLLGLGDLLRAEVLKVAHHGSKTGTEESLLRKLSPKVALISCGVGNRYGHPHASTLEALARHGWTILRTDERGAVGVIWEGDGIRSRSVR